MIEKFTEHEPHPTPPIEVCSMQITEDCVTYCDYWLPSKNALTIRILTRIRVRLAEPASSNKLKKKKRA